ncbi:MAG: SMC-Scp complex subunit ScpB [Bryobacteraceae bacterium]
MEEGINLKDTRPAGEDPTDPPEGSGTPDQAGAPPQALPPQLPAVGSPQSDRPESEPLEAQGKEEEPADASESRMTGGGDPIGQDPLQESSNEPAEPLPASSYTPEELLPETLEAPPAAGLIELRALVEAIIYITEEPVTVAQIAAAVERAPEDVEQVLAEIIGAFEKPEHGVGVREVAGGYKMATKPEHHEAVRAFVRSLKPPFKLSLAALETLAVIAYKQPVTAPEIMEIRGVQGTGVLKTLLDRKLIQTAGRKNVIGKPVLYKTTKDFLVQFGLKDLMELPTLKEFEEIRRMALPDEAPAETAPAEEAPPEPGPETPNA